MTSKMQEIKKKVVLLDDAIKKGNKKWVEEDILQLLAEISILGNKLKIGEPDRLLDKADKLVEKWYEKKSEEKVCYFDVRNFYGKWASDYDSYPNIAIYLEEKFNKDILSVKDKDVLDLGCGTGRYLLRLAKNNRVVGVDFSKEMLGVAQKNLKKSKLDAELIAQDITKYKSNKKFDLIISMLVFDHLKDVSKLLKVIYESSKIGTEFVFSGVEPARIFRAIAEKDGKAKLLDFASTNQYYHPLEEYLKILRPFGFELVDYKHIFYEKKYQTKKMKKYEKILNKPILVIYKFRRLK